MHNLIKTKQIFGGHRNSHYWNVKGFRWTWEFFENLCWCFSISWDSSFIPCDFEEYSFPFLRAPNIIRKKVWKKLWLVYLQQVYLQGAGDFVSFFLTSRKGAPFLPPAELEYHIRSLPNWNDQIVNFLRWNKCTGSTTAVHHYSLLHYNYITYYSYCKTWMNLDTCLMTRTLDRM